MICGNGFNIGFLPLNFFIPNRSMAKKKLDHKEGDLFSRELEKLIELKKNENSALRKIFDSLKKGQQKKTHNS